MKLLKKIFKKKMIRIGTAVGKSIPTGNKNVFIGYSKGNPSIGSNSIFIGPYTGKNCKI